MVTTESTPPVAENPKVSTIRGKAGLNFVIPKNKLSGALVPVAKTVNKSEPTSTTTKEEPKQPTRKTKWGPDLTQDSAVKRGRALALQTRVEQLAVQLESDSLDIDNDEKTSYPSAPPLDDTLALGNKSDEVKKREQLDLERREAIGECMRLNPAYRPPSGFKPVVKEAKLYLPVKEHPEYDCVGLIMGPQGNTQKQIEAETGAKITIRGRGANKDGKMQPTRSDGKEMDGGALEELHVHISADTYEKLDAAVAAIEPLLLPKLQSSETKIICLLCGDGGHPTIDCPLTKSEQGKVFDKQFLSFIEELGNRLKADTLTKNDQSSGNDASQPVLLTPGGSQQVLPWTASVIGSDTRATVGDGTFPKFLPQGMPSGMPRGNFPIPGFPTVESMLSAFRGRPPFPLSFTPDVRPYVPVATTASSSTTVPHTEPGLVFADGNMLQVSSTGSAISVPSSFIVPAPTMAVLASSSPVPPFPAPPVQQFPPLPPSNLRPLEVPMLPSPITVPSPVTYPMRPGVPSFRPALPSPVTPAGVHVAQQPPLTNAGAGMSAANNATLLPGNNTFPGPPQNRPGNMPVWGQGQYSRSPLPSHQGTSMLEKPPSSLPFTPMRPPAAPLSAPSASGPPSIPSPAHMQVITQPSPVVSPSITPIHPRPPHGQFPMTPNNQMVPQPASYLHPQAGLPLIRGPQLRPFNSMRPTTGNPRLTPPSHHPRSGVFHSPEMLGAPMLATTQHTQHGLGGLRGPESSHIRPVPGGAPIRADGRSPALQQPGLLVSPPSLLGDPSSRRPALAMPSPGFMNREGNAGMRPLVPAHGMPPAVQPNARSGNESWGTSLPYGNRPLLAQMRPGPFANKGWPVTPCQVRPQLHNPPIALPQTQQEVDPEYEKLMASVGVL